ncbi:MAG: hypothetical protein AVDCRST_MAG44-505 [uncultured Sphingomonas sp.]|uniref:Alginate lyase n=1 Tax=uncultured Sphingomonas sp. TaxID=158754 RepID=A0A6J4SMY3_9SPHN|nr:MAG: hypothetical protein AVDCRST_MAG44-505 [uncultured Sphingomonas sp.]
MEVSRREFSLGGLASAFGPLSLPAAAGLIIPTSGPLARTATPDALSYQSTLQDGFTPSHIHWNGRKWRCTAGSTWQPNLDHCLRLTSRKARFEIRNSAADRAVRDPVDKRRSELHYPKRPRLPNDVPLWAAMSFIHHRWDDPRGMADLWGGVHGQIHMGSTFGGSPAVAFRRSRDGAFRITTRGENATKNTVRYEAPLAFDRVHDLVYRLVLSPTDGALAVWLDGRKVVDLTGESIGSRHAECYWNFGCYYAGGVTCPVVAEFGNHVYPDTPDLSRRVAAPPAWPA